MSFANGQPDLDPERTARELDAASQGVFRASNKLSRLTRQFEGEEGQLGVGTEYEIAIEDELTTIYEECSGKPPAEDIRTAMARARVRTKKPELDMEYRRLSTEMKALQIWISQQRAVMSAKQSVLNASRALAGIGG